MTDKIKTGSNGENLAADYLARKGFRIVARNFRYKKAEIDLIVQREDWMIFVEVKTRSSNAFGEPETFVTDYQGRLIYSAAEEFIFNRDWQGHVRFDIVSVSLGQPPRIQHFEDAINF